MRQTSRIPSCQPLVSFNANKIFGQCRSAVILCVVLIVLVLLVLILIVVLVLLVLRILLVLVLILVVVLHIQLRFSADKIQF